ncbi:MAG: N-acetylmuramoyl-L-alanine amidase [Sulfurovum sp.]|nr:N-acetylmuramoyl-L-alanine amidase [Sulfurovum sp.]
MIIKNKTASFFALLIILFIGYIIYWGTTKPVSVVIQAGHEGRTTGNTGAASKLFHEEKWNIYVANAVAKQLRGWEIDVKRVPAHVRFTRAKIAVSIHFDGATNPCASGASIGYPSKDSHAFAQRWKKLYAGYFPFKWQEDNFTANLKEYYAYKWIRANKFLVLELGEITCEEQTTWLKPRLKKIAHLIAYAIATELGENIRKPNF